MIRSLSVMPGDVINAEVYAKYIDTDPDNLTGALTTLLSQIATNTTPAGTVIDGASYPTNSSSPFSLMGLNNTASSSGVEPKAYLNYVIFDKDFNFKTGGYQRLSDTPKETGSDVAHEKLSLQVNVTEPGYVYIYLSNEEETPLEVYFDDFAVEHVKSNVIASQDYYPFGLTFNSHKRENTVPDDYKYNGKEEQKELGLGWLDYGMRMYQPELGRFFTQDRFASKYFNHSPYSYGLNNPALYVDINGDSVWTTHKSTVDKNGNTTVTHTVHVQGKVLNQSNGTTKAGDVANGINARLNAQSSTQVTKNADGTTTTVTTNMSGHFTEAKSMSDVSKSDHLVVMVDGVLGGSDEKLGGGDAAGFGKMPGKVSYIESGSGAIETAFHELGHNLGLPHPSANNSSDPMSYTGRGANFSPAQMGAILDNAINGTPNRSSNYGIMSDHYPKVLQGTFYGTTNNTRPFRSAPSQNAKIPLPLINGY